MKYHLPRRDFWQLPAIAVLGFVFTFLCSCSAVPPLEQATGTSHSNILVADVVKRVKCELADSFDAKIEDPHFHWLQDWTVKTDLTLQINAQAGVSPTVSYTKYVKNAFNFDAGSTSLTSKTIGAVSQFFTLSAGANLSEQAVRTEVVSFSLALKELKVWRQEVRRLEDSAGFPPEMRICSAAGRLELEGDLGLREWVNSALYPVEVADLLAGNHPSPGAPQPKPPPSAVAPPKPSAGPAAAPVVPPLSHAQIQKLFEEISAATNAVKDAASQINKSTASVQVSTQQIRAAFDAMKKISFIAKSCGCF